ncbi:MAG: Mg(2+) transporter [Claussenomyces sp. TS43310]|nr:MAG: Mg(2+) transporter [Claussenomyces sp. TS43310]
MSYHEDFDDTRYSTPVPELDDHRNQSVSIQRPERSRRGTVDTLYGTAPRDIGPALSSINDALLQINAQDFEEAVVDGESGPISPIDRSRRPTATSVESRSVSPPNSVKAFAQARRRERELPSAGLEPGDNVSLHRTISGASRRSRRSRHHTNDNDTVSLAASTQTVEEDVCFPQQSTDLRRDKKKLYIDFDYLEKFIAEEERDHTPPKNQPKPRIFNDLRPQNSIPKILNSDGDIISVPSRESSLKEKEDPMLDEEVDHHQNLDPNRFSFFSSAWESTIHAAEFGDLIMPGEDVRGLFYLPESDQDGVWWLNMSNPTEEEIRAICKAFGVHPLTIEDIEKQETREKIELFPAYYFACFRSFHIVDTEEGPELEPFNIYVIVFREGTLSFSFAPNPHAAQVRKRITALKDYVALSSDWICYALIDDIVDSFAPSISKIEIETDNIEDQVFIARSDDMYVFLRQIGDVRKDVMALMKLLGGKADVLRGFTKRCNENYNVTPRMDIGLYLGDIQDHVVTMMSNLAHFEKMLSRSHSNYLAQLSIDNITQGNNANKVLSKITLLASILVPLNLVCAVHGLTDICWKKCMTGGIRSGKLDKGEETCAKNCVDRFLDGNLTVIKHLEQMRSVS